MSLSGLLNIARTSLVAQSGALGVTSKNVANATTPGYVRRVSNLETQSGGGVLFTGEQRVVDRFAQANVVDQTAAKGAADSRAAALAAIEAVVSPPGSTIGDSATAVMTAFVTLTAYPTDPAVRAAVLARATELANKVSSTAQALGDSSKELFGRAQSVVGELNQRLSQIADLNAQIAQAKGTGGDYGALADQRDKWITEVGQKIGVRSVEDADGRVTLFGGGVALVEGSSSTPLSVDLDPSTGNMRFTANGASAIDITNRVETGTLGGLREARDVDLAKTRDALDSYAYDVSTVINTAHRAGYGADGGTGRTLFVAPTTKAGAAAAMAINPALVGREDRIAASSTATDLPGGNGTAMAIAKLAETASFGGATLADRFAVFAGDVGSRKVAADGESSLREDTLAIAKSLSESASGVSLDEEMVDLTKYQRAFEASTKILTTVDELYAGLMRDL